MTKDTKNLGGPSPAEVETAGSIAGDVAPHAVPTHTPGPWRAQKGRIRWSVLAGAGMYVAYDLHMTSSEKANAHLIAAAPELYEALKEAKRHISGSAPVMIRLWEQVDAALRKAEGRQP